MKNKTFVFPGRWQPFHAGHMAIINKKLDEGYNALILVRDTPVSDANPYSVNQRINMIKLAYGDDYGKKVTAISFPDFSGIAYGRGVGWEIEEVDVGAEIKKISATAIRKSECDSMSAKVKRFIDNQKTTFWFTGLPCSGKTTLCKAIEKELNDEGYITTLMDGDILRDNLCSDLGFSPSDRTENIRRVSSLCNIFNENNNLVLASFLSPTKELRDICRSNIENIKVIHISTPLSVCEERDTKGMYAKARSGDIKEFTGVSAPYDDPETPDLVMDASGDVDDGVSKFMEWFCNEQH